MKSSPVGSFRVHEGNLAIYLRDISRYKPLSGNEECALAVRIREGDRRALERLVKTNLRFVISVARKYQHQGMSLADLINEGNIGLIKAARRFDETKNFKFISYAVWWIRQAILQSLANQSRILRVPVNRVATIQRLGKTRARLEQRYRRVPNAGEVAAEMGISEEEVLHTIRVERTHASLDAPVANDSSSPLAEFVTDDRQARPDAVLTTSALTDSIEHLLSPLAERERSVVCLYFGIGEETSHTLDEIAQRFDITRERVRQIKKTALNKLKCTCEASTSNVFS